MEASTKIGACVAVVAVAAIAAYYAISVKLQFTSADMTAVYRDTAREVREAVAKDPDSVFPIIERMRTEEVCRARFRRDWPGGYVPMGRAGRPPEEARQMSVTSFLPRIVRERRVPAGHLAGIMEELFIRFTGDGYPDAAMEGRIKRLIAIAESLEPELSADNARTLRERMLDARFIVHDYDGAVAILEKGMDGHSENWCKAAAAKIRAHQAEEKKDYAEALRQFAIFVDRMSAEPDSGHSECDPSTGIAYSRAWVLAKNNRRCAEYAKLAGRGEEAAAYHAKAKELYAKALQDTADDPKSLEALKKEIAEAGL